MKISQMVLQLQSGHEFVTDRRTDDQGKNKMSPNPTGGDTIGLGDIIIESLYFPKETVKVGKQTKWQTTESDEMSVNFKCGNK